MAIYIPLSIASFILCLIFVANATTPEERAVYQQQAAEKKIKAEQEEQAKEDAEAKRTAEEKAEKEAIAKEKEEAEAKEKAEAQAKEDAEAEKKMEEESVKSISWEDKIREVASSDKSETEKFDEINKYARDYKPTNDEVTKFENDIIKEYKNKKYIMDVSNHEYMLGNIFKSQVVEQNSQEQMMRNFAFDFFQNSKYNYRGVENMNSEPTLANERQMDKALNEMGK